MDYYLFHIHHIEKHKTGVEYYCLDANFYFFTNLLKLTF